MSDTPLEHARALLGLTQRELDRRAGLTEGTVNQIERGHNRRPSYETVVRIVRAFQSSGLKGITAEQLFPVPDHRDPATDTTSNHERKRSEQTIAGTS